MKYLFFFSYFSSTQACTQIAYIKQKKLIHLLKICIQNIIMTKRSSKNYFKILKKKKLPKFFKAAPERRLTWNGCNAGEAQCINYKKLFVNESNIQNGSKFIRQNYKSLKNATEVYACQVKL